MEPPQSPPLVSTHRRSPVIGIDRAYYDVFADSMDIEDALEDSPMFRKKIRNAENTVDDLASGIKKVLKCSKHYQAAAHSYEETLSELVAEILNLKTNMGICDENLDKGFNKVATALKDIVRFQSLLAQQMESLTPPLLDYINTDVKVVKETTKKYEKATSQIDSVLTKLGQVKKKNSQRVEELETELAVARKAHATASLDVALTINEVIARKRVDFLERIEACTQAHKTFFHQGYECFKDLEPHVQNYALQLHSTRRYFEAEKKLVSERRAALEANPMLPRTTSHISLANSVKRGYLFRRTAEDVINTWSKRYFVLQDNQLFAYKNKDQQPELVVPLLLYTVKSREDLERRNCFELLSPPDKSILLQAENEESKQEWTQAIQACISSSLNAQPAHEQKQDGANGFSVGVQLLRQQNNVCADCDSKDPEWASINLGILLCIDCSGIHRSMGVHISKVRSLTLDSWDFDLVEAMSTLGNAKVNEIFEAQVPPDRQKPSCTATWEVRQKWIRDKYELKKFVKSSTFSPTEMHAQLAEAITNDNAVQIVRLIAQGVDLNYQDPTNKLRTALHLAVAAKRPAIVLLMLLNAADPSVKDENGWTPLHLSADLSLANCAIPLLQKNSVHILSFTDKNNRTPLDLAVANGGADCVTLFRLALLAKEENGNVSFEESFAQALKMFSLDARTKNAS